LVVFSGNGSGCLQEIAGSIGSACAETHGAANSAAFATARNESGDIIGVSAATLASDFADYVTMIAVDVAGEPAGGSVDDGSFDIVGYVDQDRASCKSVQADPDAYSELERKIAFQSEYGFYPVQCIPQSGVLEHREEFIRAYIRKATEAGFHVHVHALADKGIRIAVDEFSKVKDLADRRDPRPSGCSPPPC